MAENLSRYVFWLFALLLIYVYAGYPLLLWILSKWFPAKNVLGAQPLPKLSLLISAYNEEGVIGGKLRNSVGLDYPRELLEILVISDCSSDGTDAIVKSFPSPLVRLIRQPQRLGKSAALNFAVPIALGDIVVFSDANAIYEPSALQQLVRHFADPKIGYVVGNARYVESADSASSAKSEGLYWKLETWLKLRESGFGSVVGGDGAIYAIRRELYSPLRPTDINDLLNPLQIILRGYRGIYEPAAVCFEEAGDSFDKEFHRKVRIVGRSLNAVLRAPGVLLPWNQFRHWFCLISHKLLRWFAPIFMIGVLFSNLALLHVPLYRVFLAAQSALYTLTVLAWLLPSHRDRSRLLYIPYYFFVVNTASLLGILNCFTGSLPPTWKTIRVSSPIGSPDNSGTDKQAA